ncbi:MAG: GIY-YIG nuclease family protein [Marinoscillum sp.]
MFFVYIIYSKQAAKYYKGFTSDPLKRVAQHNRGESRYTSIVGDWELIYLEIFDDKSDALKREKVLKKYDHKQINRLVGSPKNQLSEYLNK